MNVFLPLLIVAIAPSTPIDARYPGCTEIFHCTFDASWDANFDGWPDGWSRRLGPKFPQYLKVKISDDSSPASEGCLRIDLDGAGAVAYSPPIRVGPLHDLVLECFLETEGLEHSRAFLSLRLFDEEGPKRYPLESFQSEKVCRTDGWQKIRLGPIAPRHARVHWAIVGLHLEPGARADLTGVARFDDVWLGRTPRLTLSADSSVHLFADRAQVTITCDASGFTDPGASVILRLEDPWGGSLVESRHALKGPVEPGELARSAAAATDAPPGLVGSADWQIPLPGPGFYRVGAVLEGESSSEVRRRLTLAVIRPQRPPSRSEFGWTLPDGGRPLDVAELAGLIAEGGIRWVKCPLWDQRQDPAGQLQQVVTLSERLLGQGVELVGLLHAGAAAAQKPPAGSAPLWAAEIFTEDSGAWFPPVEKVMTELTAQVRWWQLGDDTDTSFVGFGDLATKVAAVKAKLDRVGHDVNLGLGWSWIHQFPQAEEPEAPWRFLALSAAPRLTPGELSDYLATPTAPHLARWVALEPLSARDYPLNVRTADLLQRILAAKIHGAEGIFIPNPFGDDRGLIRDDGTVGELFLPWRTAALLLGGARYLGSIELPSGSQNHIFAADGDTVMVVFNDTPVEEVIYLGEHVRQVDPWGRSTVPARQDHRHVIEVGPQPQFVTGIDAMIVRFRQSFSLAADRVPSVFDLPHANAVRMKNPYDHGISGTLDLATSQPWQLSPPRAEFRLAGGQPLEQAFQITLPRSATTGAHKIRADLVLQGDRKLEFSVYRQIDVGDGGLSIDVVTLLNARGDLEVRQHFLNQTGKPVSFRCQLYAPKRRTLTTRVERLGGGIDAKTYRLPDGRALVGQPLWLRAREIDGPRVLSYRFTATE